jgi:hypothetical protein
MQRVKKTVAIPKDLIKWAEKAIKNMEYSCVFFQIH